MPSHHQPQPATPRSLVLGMSMTESWFGDTLERNYFTELEFTGNGIWTIRVNPADKSVWPDTYKGADGSDKASWTYLDLLGYVKKKLFKCRISVTRSAQSVYETLYFAY